MSCWSHFIRLLAVLCLCREALGVATLIESLRIHGILRVAHLLGIIRHVLWLASLHCLLGLRWHLLELWLHLLVVSSSCWVLLSPPLLSPLYPP